MSLHSRIAAHTLVAFLLVFTLGSAMAAPLHIVAVGASNTHGWYLGNAGAYPAALEQLLRARGIDAHVTNAGVPFDTTAAMLQRIDGDVPEGTDIVILQPGGNDLRFFGTKEQRSANLSEMERRVRARSMEVVVYDDEIPAHYKTFDTIHLTREGHQMIANALLPRILAVIQRRAKQAPKPAARRAAPAAASQVR